MRAGVKTEKAPLSDQRGGGKKTRMVRDKIFYFFSRGGWCGCLYVNLQIIYK